VRSKNSLKVSRCAAIVVAKQSTGKFLCNAGVYYLAYDLTAHIQSGSLRFLIMVGLYFSSSLIGGVLLAKLVEFPVLAIRDRFFPSKSPVI
ncbi:hypothetical protein MRY87_06595, partial [bacterium]|nr:hypothetical protein [bacterium]